MKGFTLIELTIVLSIIAILFGAVTLNLNSFVYSIKLNTAAKEIVSTLYLAQKLGESEVISKSGDISYTVRKFDTKTDNFKIIKTGKLPDGIYFGNDKIIKFSNSGFPKVGGSGTLVLKSKNGKAKQIIISSIGRIRIS